MYERREPEGSGPPSERSGVSPALIVLGIVAIVAVIFIVQNSEQRDIEFLFVDIKSPVWVALLVAIAIGIVLDRVFTYWWRRRRNRDAA